ncbi:MAG TPA: hypothetical protein VIK27_10050 [Candidatus Aquilonibacter sp.]
MSTADFEAQLRQSVQDHVALIQAAAKAAKARIVQSAQALAMPSETFEPSPAPEPRAPRAAVNFDVEEPAFEVALRGEAPAFDDSPIAFDDLAVENVDDEGIPVWEDAP